VTDEQASLEADWSTLLATLGPRVTAALTRRWGDFCAAEDALQEALVEAWLVWHRDGPPRSPGAWVLTAAKRKVIDHLRKDPRRGHEDVETLVWEDEADPGPADRRLDLMLLCCTPALPEDQRVALTLHALLGFSVAQLSATFLVPVATMAQRLVRAKRKIRDAGIRLTVPEEPLLEERGTSVLRVLYLVFSEGYSAPWGPRVVDGALCDDAIWLTGLFCEGAPTYDFSPTLQAEAWGLLALMRFHHARSPGRTAPWGGPLVLEDQDPGTWDRSLEGEGERAMRRALALGLPGPYQIQGAIAHLHLAPGPKDWNQIAALYNRLLTWEDTPVVRLNALCALSKVIGEASVLGELEALGGSLASYPPYHLALAEAYHNLERHRDAEAALRVAFERLQNPLLRESVLEKLQRWAPDTVPTPRP